MKNLSIKDLVDFRQKTERSKKTFVANLKLESKESSSDGGGGDYWKICTSAISNAFKTNDVQILKDKIYEVEEKFEDTDHKPSKLMYRRNIEILSNYEDYDFNKLKPSNKLIFIKKPKAGLILTIKGLQIKADPHHVFMFKKNEVEEVGAVWFIARLEGLRKEELGMFTDIMYRYLKANFSKDYTLNPKYCIAVDVVNLLEVNYAQIEKGQIPAILASTLEEVKKLM